MTPKLQADMTGVIGEAWPMMGKSCILTLALLATGPTAPAVADDGAEDHILGPFSSWSAPRNLGAPVNTSMRRAPAQPDGHTIYFNRNFNNTNPDFGKTDEDLYVTSSVDRRTWSEPNPVDKLNTPTFNERTPPSRRALAVLLKRSDRWKRWT